MLYIVQEHNTSKFYVQLNEAYIVLVGLGRWYAFLLSIQWACYRIEQDKNTDYDIKTPLWMPFHRQQRTYSWKSQSISTGHREYDTSAAVVVAVVLLIGSPSPSGGLVVNGEGVAKSLIFTEELRDDILTCGWLINKRDSIGKLSCTWCCTSMSCGRFL